ESGGYPATGGRGPMFPGRRAGAEPNGPAGRAGPAASARPAAGSLSVTSAAYDPNRGWFLWLGTNPRGDQPCQPAARRRTFPGKVATIDQPDGARLRDAARSAPLTAH